MRVECRQEALGVESFVGEESSLRVVSRGPGILLGLAVGVTSPSWALNRCWEGDIESFGLDSRSLISFARKGLFLT